MEGVCNMDVLWREGGCWKGVVAGREGWCYKEGGTPIALDDSLSWLL